MQFFKRHKRTILIIIIALLAARVFIPQLDALADSLKIIGEANIWWLLLGVVLYFTGVPVLAGQFVALSFKKMTYALTLRVQAATLFVNKILPQGVGTISLNIYYFIKKGHTPSQASAAVTVNAIASTSAYIVLIVFALIYSDVSISVGGIGGKEASPAILTIASLIIIGSIITLMSAKGLRQKAVSTWTTFKNNISAYKTRPKSLIINTILNGIGTSLNVLTLMVCAQAIGIDVSFADALIAYTFGNFAATLVPTPGGIGSAEMGIYSGLVIVGVDSASAISITLLYRLISYWLPILPGYYFFQSLRKTIFADYTIGGKSQKTATANASAS